MMWKEKLKDFDEYVAKNKTKIIRQHHLDDEFSGVKRTSSDEKILDSYYRNAFSTGTRIPLKKGETWRGRIVKYAEMEGKMKKVNKTARRDRMFEFKTPRKRCPTCTSQAEFLNLLYKQPKGKAGAIIEKIVNDPKTYCPKCGGIPAKKAVRKDSAGSKVAKQKRVAHCRACKQPLHQMRYYLGGDYPSSHCLNHKCRLYGIAQGGKTGLKESKQSKKARR